MDGTNRKRKRWLLRFSLATLLLGMVVVAGYFTGYRFGLRQAQQDVSDSKVIAEVHNVADLIKPLDAPADWTATQADFEPLLELITSTVASEEWANGTGSVNPFVKNKSLVVTCSWAGHAELSELLQQLRTLRYKLPDNYLRKVREVAGRQKPTRQIIKAFTDDASDSHTIMQNHYDSALHDLTAEFGTPTQIAAAGQAEYPEWIGAQQIAVWNRGAGKLYFALVDCRPKGEALVVGWWEDSVGPLEPLELAVSP